MRCARCQHENPGGAKFCLECGAPLLATCPACRATSPAGAKFCIECGQPIDVQQAGAGRFRSPQAYTPTHLAEKILTSRGSLEGERKQVTVLFADLKGSMELLTGRDPEIARSLLDPVLELMMEAVHRYEGTVNQVMGDGIMALFGAPLAHEEHAVRACYAGLRMQESVRRYAETVGAREGVRIAIRVGLNSGEVVVRSIGSDLHMDYTAVGQTTHLAARMEQMAESGTILITADVMRLVEGYVRVMPMGPIQVKGVDAPIEAFELTGAGPVRTRLQASAARGLTRFVGREDEIAQLHQALERARAGQGQIVAVVGEPGVGKSRLFWEFTHSRRALDWLMLDSRSVSYGKATTYLPFIDLLKTYFQIEDRDDARKIREKLTGKLLSLDEALLPTLPAFLALLDIETENPDWEALEPPRRRQRILEAVKRLLLRESRVQPLLLVFEDLHWIDSETQALLDSLVESIPAARILLLVNYRPQYQHGWGGKSYYMQLRIDPLQPDTAESLLNALVGDDRTLNPLKPLLIARADGNPFFLEEIVRTLVETEILMGPRGAYRLGKALDVIQVPPTVQAVLAARIDRLPPEEKRLLQSAAVIGKNVPFELLQAIAEQPEDALRGGLAHLQTGEFLYETSLFPDLEYTFKHSLTHDVAYGSLLQTRRRALHAKIVEAMETLYRDRLAEQVERLAYHGVRGEAWDKAVLYLPQAGTKAASRSSYREAVVHFEEGLAALEHLPQTRQTQEQAIQLHFALRNALLPLGALDRIVEHLRRAETLADALGDRRRLGRISAYMCNYFWWVGEPERALEYGARALARADEVGDLALHVFTKLCLGQVYHAMGDYRRAADLLRPNVEVIEGGLLRERFSVAVVHLLSRSWLVDCLVELGQFAEATAIGEEGVSIAEEVGHPYGRIVAYLGTGLCDRRKGDFHRAIPRFQRVLTLCEGGDLPVDLVLSATHLGYAYAQSDRIAEAVSLLERAVQQAVAVGLVFGHALTLVYLAEAYLRDGRRSDAIDLARRALDLARRHKERGHEAYALWLHAEIAARAEPPDVGEAERAYRQTQQLAGELGMRPLQAHCHLALGSLLRRAARGEEAYRELAAAVEMLGAMEMTRWLPRAVAELTAAGGPPL